MSKGTKGKVGARSETLRIEGDVESRVCGEEVLSISGSGSFRRGGMTCESKENVRRKVREWCNNSKI